MKVGADRGVYLL